MRAPRWIYVSVLGALFVGCPNPGELDSDGDGTPDTDDCAPFDANIHPDQTEQCDGLDINCDGVADDGFDDNDGDGVASCGGAPVGGFQEDCDDNDPDVRPGLIEACDGIDNNCNATIDEVTDIDGDGFTNCGAQPDCDDGNPDVNPGATEVCDNRDNNCNVTIDEGFDVDNDGLTTCRGDCNDNNNNVRPGAAEICDNADNNCNNEVDEGFDIDGDGFTSCGGDCDDLLANRNPNAAEICDLFDNNCNNQIDEGFDIDGDGSTSCGGDCNDNDNTIDLGNAEVDDNKDNDCNGLIDEIFDDNDGDGFSPAQGDCDDTLFEVGPGAIEFQGNNVDDDCDGTLDEGLVPCDAGLSGDGALDSARAIGFCNNEIISASYITALNGNNALSDIRGREIVANFGTNGASSTNLNVPAEGARMLHLSTGVANTANHDRGTFWDGVFDFTFNTNPIGTNTTAPHPLPQPNPNNGCGAADPLSVFDYTELNLQIRVPTNAQSFSYNFQFFSSEYPTFRCTAFDDTFLAILDSGAFDGNISFDNSGNFVSINNGFFDVCQTDNGARCRLNNGTITTQICANEATCDNLFGASSNCQANARPANTCTVGSAPLAGTGYIFDNTPSGTAVFSEGAGGTTRLTTSSPVIPGEIITLRFVIFDEGDEILDSSALIDNFQWQLDPIAGPVTQQ